MKSNTLRCTAVWIGLLALPLSADQNGWNRAMAEARCARQAGRMHEASAAYEQALRATELDESLMVERATTIGSLASLFHDLQQLRKAEKGYLEAIQMLRQQQPQAVRNHIAPILISLAALYVESHQPSRAVNLRLDELTPTIEAPALKANAYGILGTIAFMQNRITDAESWWIQSLALSEAAKRPDDVAAALGNLGLAAAAKQDLRAATAYFRRSVERFRTSMGLEHPLSVNAQANLGQALFRVRQYDESVEWLGKAQQLALKWYGVEHVITTEIRRDYAVALHKSGRKKAALALLKEMEQLPAAVTATLPRASTIDILDGIQRR